MADKNRKYTSFVPRDQNISGHITLNVEQSGALQEIIKKETMIRKMHALGEIKQKPMRNPLKAERSPRGEFFGYDFSVPEKNSEPERWHYPESDWGLMAKFNSQQPIYSKIFEREAKEKAYASEVAKARAHNERLIKEEKDKMERIRRQIAEESEKEARRIKEMEDQMNAPEEYYQVDMDALLGEASEMQKGGRMAGKHKKKTMKPKITLHRTVGFDHGNIDHTSEQTVLYTTQSSINSLKKELLSKNSVNDFKASTIRGLAKETPQVLEKYRADRAAKFIARMGESALKPPPVQAREMPVFRPGGSIQPKSMNNTVDSQIRSSSPKGTSSNHGGATIASPAIPPLSLLKTELVKTEEMIERQKLKIALNAKPTKRYQTAPTKP